MMKKMILLTLAAVVMVICLIIAGCDDVKNQDGTYTHTGGVRIYVLDSCEYFGLLDNGNGNFLSHKGNCRFCQERKKSELKEVVEQLKGK